MAMPGIVDIIGWIGALLLLGAYWAGVQKHLKPEGRTYNILNALGSIFMGINVFANEAYPSVAVNAIWLAIALNALLPRRVDKDVT
jgi:hypothetical protein